LAWRATALLSLAAFLNALIAVPLAHASLVEDLVSQGNRHYLRGEPEEAREAYRKALAVQGNDALAHYNLGVLLFETGDLDGALTHFEQSANVSPERPQAWSNLAIVLCAKGYFDQAENAARRAIAASPGFAPAHNNLGLVLDALERPAAARAAFEAALARGPFLAEARNNVGNTLARAGETDTAKVAYDAGILANPKLAYLYFNRGLLALHTGDYDSAVRDWERARRLDPAAAPDFVIASVALRGGDYRKAIRHFEAVDTSAPAPSIPVDLDDFKPLFAPSGIEDPDLAPASPATGVKSSGGTAGARAKETRVDPERLSRDYADLGRVSWDRGLDERAMKLLEDALVLDPRNDSARESLGTVYLKRDQPENAVSVLAPLEEGSPTSAQLVLLGDAYTGASRLEDAQRIYQRAVKLDPKAARAHVGLGWLQIRVRSYERGIDSIRRGVALAPRESYGRVTLADALQITDRPERAEREYRRSLRDNPGDARAHSHYASFLASQRRYSEARRHYSKALEYDPEAPGVEEELDRLRRRKPAKISNIWEGILIMPVLPFVGVISLFSKVAK
jgi:tetratricopeptide (TPR) repeat protein